VRIYTNRFIFKMLFVFLLLAIFMFEMPVAARVKDTDKKRLTKPLARPAEEGKVHNVGTLWNQVSNYGAYGHPDQANPSMEWPGGSEAHYLWDGRFWVGGMVDGEKLVSHYDYGDVEWAPKDGGMFKWGPGASIQDSEVEYDDLEVQTGHTPMGLEVFERSLAWSMGNYDDFIAYEYEVRNVGENIIDGFFISKNYDCDLCQLADPSEPHIDDLVAYDGWDGDESDVDIVDWVDPLDLDGDGLTGYDEWGWPYGWAHNSSGNPTNPNYNPSLAEPDGFYDTWQVLLKEDGPVIHWQTSVPDLNRVAGEVAMVGGEALRGYLISRNTSYMWDDDYAQTPDIDIGERGGSQPLPGFIGTRLIYSDIIKQTDVFPYQTTAEDTFLRPYSHQWWNWESDPGTDIEKYDYMSAQHSASTQMGKHYNFLPNPFDVNAPVFDYRYLISTGPFNNFGPGESIRVVMVSAVGNGLQGMRENLDFAMKAYYEGSTGNPYQPTDWKEDIHWVLPIPPPIPGLVYSPASDGAAVELSWDNLAETTIDAMLGMIDFEGYKIYRSLYNPSAWEMIYACDNRDEPVILTNTDGEIMNPLDADGNPIPVDLPAISHTYRDQGGTFMGREISEPIYGLKYYYVVVAFDPNKPATASRPAMASQESAKSNYKKTLEGAPLDVIPRYAPIGVSSDNDLGKETPDNAQKRMAASTSAEMKDIKVVPNPYKGTALFESRYEDKILFTNLPPACKISIYTLTGDLIDTIYHSDGYGDELWSLISRNNQKVVSGLYIYVVERKLPTYDKFVGKFVIIR